MVMPAVTNIYLIVLFNDSSPGASVMPERYDLLMGKDVKCMRNAIYNFFVKCNYQLRHVSLSLRPHRKTRLPLVEYSLSFVHDYFF